MTMINPKIKVNGSDAVVTEALTESRIIHVHAINVMTTRGSFQIPGTTANSISINVIPPEATIPK